MCSPRFLNPLRSDDAYMYELDPNLFHVISAPSHYLNPWWLTVYRALSTNFNDFLNRNWNISIQENTFEGVVRKMAAMLWRAAYVNW